ncbi:fibronectin type III domain-containing protein [Rhodococcus artemisiae]|uniref:Fibronectin type III domain-containing protein n=1 Tax=Rhodococcus artemisiae TaxID=714159 RepID=A0ABU7LBR0_9NOCA|nr:fibronectin type III domain-containing protein [Rhodococcus artemisiae]MEE2058986.1 fibronectin type III domain-containing protein [Rhodococcus artemisiae]
MTAPNQSSPDGSLGIGDFASWQAMTEADAKNKMKIPLSAWNTAQQNIGGTYARGDYTHREVVRLDNRIDEIVVGTEKGQIATFSTSDVWVKPPGATRVIVDVLASSSGGGRSNNGGNGGAYRGGTGGYSGGWTKLEFNPEDLPDEVEVILGGPGAGATSDGSRGSAGGDAAFGVLAVATGGQPAGYGTGNNTFSMRGGTGGSNGNGGTAGSAGSFDPGGKGSPDGSGGRGENGFSVGAGKVGAGSGGGGGGQGAVLGGNGGRGGDGGWPQGPGGGGGAYISFGFAGNGGIGASGAVYVTTIINTAVTVPFPPSDVLVSNISSTSAIVTWAAPTLGVPPVSYEISANGDLAGTSPTTGFNLTNLTPSTPYAVRVRSVDADGQRSNFSMQAVFTTTA